MDIQDLQAVLRERADAEGAGAPDLDDLVGKGQALRRRRRFVASAVAGVVAAAAISIPVLLAGGSDSGGGPATILPASSAPVPAPSSASPTPAPSAPSPSVSVVVPPVATLTPPPSASSAPPITVTLAPVDTSILVYGDCQTPTFEPSAIVLTCADRNDALQNLQWTSWTSTSATAIGTEVYNDCTPSCAEGRTRQISGVSVTLTTPVRDDAGRLLWSEVQRSPQPPGYATGPYHGGPEPLPITRI